MYKCSDDQQQGSIVPHPLKGGATIISEPEESGYWTSSVTILTPDRVQPEVRVGYRT